MRRGIPPIPKVVGPNGKRPCRGCGGEIPKGFQTWCGRECREKHYMALSSFARHRVAERDKGVCALCGADSRMVQRILAALRRMGGIDCSGAVRLIVAAWQARDGWDWHYGHLWEADHIVPLVEGGTNDLSNYRTLCVPCHKNETRALRKRMAGKPDAPEIEPMPLFAGRATPERSDTHGQ